MNSIYSTHLKQNRLHIKKIHNASVACVNMNGSMCVALCIHCEQSYLKDDWRYSLAKEVKQTPWL
jgi:hypothetical protein